MGRIQPAVDLQHGNDQSDVRTNVPVQDQPGVQPRVHHFHGGSEIARLTDSCFWARSDPRPFLFCQDSPTFKWHAPASPDPRRAERSPDRSDPAAVSFPLIQPVPQIPACPRPRSWLRLARLRAHLRPPILRGAIHTQPGKRGSPARHSRTGKELFADNLEANREVKIGGICCAITTGTGKFAGSAGSTLAKASGPPVETPMATT